MGLTPAAVTITGARKRFGSCSASNRICYSWRLMQYPEAAVDYVVVHELAHIVHKDHSRCVVRSQVHRRDHSQYVVRKEEVHHRKRSQCVVHREAMHRRELNRQGVHRRSNCQDAHKEVECHRNHSRQDVRREAVHRKEVSR